MLQGMSQGHAVSLGEKKKSGLEHDLFEVPDFEETSEISLYISF